MIPSVPLIPSKPSVPSVPSVPVIILYTKIDDIIFIMEK
jgi:hypothetical protein